ncbi:MAG: hypothetical protein Q4B69_00165 [Slackia sp.]|nr:hypothetical protein [Slackia sp.]
MHDADRREESFRPTPPPPPREQVVGEVSPDSAECGDAFVRSAPAEHAGEARAHTDDDGDSGRLRAQNGSGGSKRRIIAIAVAAGVLALVAAAAFAAMVLGSADAVPEERAIDPKPPIIAARSNDEAVSAESEQAQEDVSAQLSALAGNEDGVLERYVEQFIGDYDAGVDTATSYRFSDLGITPEELAEKLQEGLSFSVEGADVYGDKAWVEVSVASKSFSDQADVFAASVAFGSDAADAEQYKEYLKESLLGAFDKVKPREESLLVVIERGDAGWSLSSEDVATLLGAAWYG